MRPIKLLKIIHVTELRQNLAAVLKDIEENQVCYSVCRYHTEIARILPSLDNEPGFAHYESIRQRLDKRWRCR